MLKYLFTLGSLAVLFLFSITGVLFSPLNNVAGCILVILAVSFLASLVDYAFRVAKSNGDDIFE